MISQAYQTIQPTILTQGDDGTPSVISIKAKQENADLAVPFAVRVQVRNSDGSTVGDSTNATIAATSGYGQLQETHQATKDLTFETPVAVKATGTLTVSGVVVDGEHATLGVSNYGFDAGYGHIDADVDVDISSYTTASSGTLGMATIPTADDDTVTMGGIVYTFVANGTANYPLEVSIGANVAAAQVNLVAAVMGTDDYNTANPHVSLAAFDSDTAVCTALVGGVAGDAIITTETFTDGTDAWVAGTLGSGADCTAANAIIALAAAIVGDADAVCTAVDGAGDTLVATADTAGTAGNDIVSTEEMANAAWGAVKLASGAESNDGEIRVSLTDATIETVVLMFGHPGIRGLSVDYSEITLPVSHGAA